ncbi:class E sortase [Nocardioides luteus]|uniref:class E sortase n=1 Tax=Nocardioides luteus TaxID=1844 RepID=UPI001A312B06|nr:class E sortase [Nocardioides luteus]MBG6095433.1 sortase A [Nocardioides luteus]
MSTESQTPHRGRRSVFVAGIVMVVAGLVVLGYVAWELYGTTIVSKQRQQDAASRIERAWGSGETTVTTEFGSAEALIEIPRIGEDYRVPVLEGTSDRALGAGFGHFDGTAGPGEVGNFALAGHRVTHGEPLHDLPELRPGDEIRVLTREKTYVYALTSGGEDLIVPFTSIWVTDPLPDNPVRGGVEPDQKKGQRLITLTTCSELFHTDNRMIAFGKLVSEEPTR